METLLVLSSFAKTYDIKCCSSVTNCKNNSNVTGVCFFMFPKDLQSKVARIKFVDKREWQPNTNSFICSAYFPAHHITAKGHLKP